MNNINSLIIEGKLVDITENSSFCTLISCRKNTIVSADVFIDAYKDRVKNNDEVRIVGRLAGGLLTEERINGRTTSYVYIFPEHLEVKPLSIDDYNISNLLDNE